MKWQSLGPPDGKFLDCMKAAIEKINENACADSSKHPVVIRLLFGNIPAMPVSTNKRIAACIYLLLPCIALEVTK